MVHYACVKSAEIPWMQYKKYIRIRVMSLDNTPETSIVGQMQILNWNEIESMMLSSALLFLSSVDP